MAVVLHVNVGRVGGLVLVQAVGQPHGVARSYLTASDHTVPARDEGRLVRLGCSSYNNVGNANVCGRSKKVKMCGKVKVCGKMKIKIGGGRG